MSIHSGDEFYVPGTPITHATPEVIDHILKKGLEHLEPHERTTLEIDLKRPVSPEAAQYIADTKKRRRRIIDFLNGDQYDCV